MPRNHRLSRTDFKNMRGFQRLQGRFFSLSFGILQGRTSPGAACVVSAKVASKASERNRIKRRCRAVMVEQVHGRGNRVFVVVAKKGAGGATFAETTADLHNLFERAQSRG